METPASERMPAFSFVRGLLGVGLACRRSRYRVRLSSCESPEPVRSAPSAASVEHQLAELTMRLERAGTLGATRSTLNGARHGKKGGRRSTYISRILAAEASQFAIGSQSPSMDRFRLRVALCGPRRKSPCMPIRFAVLPQICRGCHHSRAAKQKTPVIADEGLSLADLSSGELQWLCSHYLYSSSSSGIARRGGGGRLPIVTARSAGLPLRITFILISAPGFSCAMALSSAVVSVIG